MLIKIGFFFVFIKLLFFINIDEVSACALTRYDDGGCCKRNVWSAAIFCPGPYVPNCNIFEYNCVGCTYVFHKENQCTVNVYCSCFYCCDKKYAETCPDGCRGCILDGIGGCPENMLDSYKTIGNSSSSMPKSETKAWKAFNMIDADKSGSISLNEAVKHLDSKPDNGTFAKHLAKNLSWFVEIDRNANNQIEPWEFDRSLIGVDN